MMNSRSEGKILCPWCGAEMDYNWRVKGYAEPARDGWYECEACGSKSPTETGEDKLSAMTRATVRALRRYTPPIKPMTFEEVERVVFSNDLNDEMPMYLEDADGDTDWEISYQMTYLCRALKDDYGKSWRCWERKPTDEERSAAEWG